MSPGLKLSIAVPTIIYGLIIVAQTVVFSWGSSINVGAKFSKRSKVNFQMPPKYFEFSKIMETAERLS